jgi:hypothetical protein
MRNSHPLDFISELQQKTYSIINNMAEKHGTWRLQALQNDTNSLVPHGVKLFLDRSEQASKCTVTRIGNGGIVTAPYFSGSELKFRSKKTVDMENSTCTCGMWNVDLFPCACAIAVAVSQGKVASAFVATACHQSYFIQASALMDITKTLKPLLAPTIEELELSEGIEKDDNFPVLLPPPQRTKETHGKNKRKRKESSKKGSKTRGRTQTSSYACASASAPMRKEARQICSICVRNGRKVPKELWHKAKYCPYEVGDNAKVPLQVPAMTRLRSQNKMTYKQGIPRREEKPRILSCMRCRRTNCLGHRINTCTCVTSLAKC